MADKNDAFPDNVKGTYYVDRSCIACDACCLAAPDNFKMDEDDGHAYVSRQPEGDEEKELCVEAMEACPVESIGDDGDS